MILLIFYLILHHMLCQPSCCAHIQDVNSSMDRIHVTRVKDMYQVIRFLHQLRKSLTEDDSPPPRVIIIDSVPALYFPFMGSEDNSRGNNIIILLIPFVL